ncbi:MAG: PHP domain-containing protein [Alphaproteobacteria bacterium]|uniref:PHP domain-containing protein n=1 Tax=Candidatus Nitrobium versatile TaxID=2884831 RepID=A0A953M246_9BACT|nr:PHP domain-containing protein [Candidatus Nitrobium versatile]
MKCKVDLHVHSKFSGDNEADPEESILQAIGRGLQGIAFTEHYFYGASEPIESLREKYKNRIRIFRGVEFSTAEGHCLVFGVDTDGMSLKYAPVEELVRIVADLGGVVIPSHPYRKGSSLGDAVLRVKGLCAIEGFNGCTMPAWNERAIGAARVLRLPFTGGSDAHASREVGMCYTEFDDEVTGENLVALLKKGNFRGVDTRKVSAGSGFFK